MMSCHLISLGLLGLLAVLSADAVAQSGSSRPTTAAVFAESSLKRPAAFAEDVADLARRCWLRREPSFAGFVSVQVSIAKDQAGRDSAVVSFSDRRAPRQLSGRMLRVVVAQLNRNELTVVAQQLGAAEAVPVLQRDLEALLKGRQVRCRA